MLHIFDLVEEKLEGQLSAARGRYEQWLTGLMVKEPTTAHPSVACPPEEMVVMEPTAHPVVAGPDVCPFCSEVVEKNFWSVKRLTSVESLKKGSIEQKGFCYTHDKWNSVYPAGVANGYPTQLSQDVIKHAVLDLKAVVLSIISGEQQSSFKDDCFRLHQELGKYRAKSK
jgi:hypothetical protein